MSSSYINGNLYTDPYYYQNTGGVSTGNVDETSSIYDAQPAETVAATDTVTTTTAKDNKCTDGKDDGKIGFFKKLGSAVKGVGKAIGGAVCSVIPGASVAAKALGWKDAPKFSPKAAILTAGAIALTIACPPAGIALAALVAAHGAVTVGKGVYHAATAQTDAEAVAAFEDIGSGTLEVGLSVAGAKAGIKSCGNTSAALGSEASGFAKVGEVAKGFKADVAESTLGQAAKGSKLGSNIVGELEGATGNLGKVRAVKTGVNKTLKETKLGQNIENEGVWGGVKKSSSELHQNIKANLEEKRTNFSNKTKAAKEYLKAKREVNIAKKDLQAVDPDDINVKMARQDWLDGTESDLKMAKAKLDEYSTFKNKVDDYANRIDENSKRANDISGKSKAVTTEDLQAGKALVDEAKDAVKKAEAQVENAADDAAKVSAKETLEKAQGELKTAQKLLTEQQKELFNTYVTPSAVHDLTANNYNNTIQNESLNYQNLYSPSNFNYTPSNYQYQELNDISFNDSTGTWT